MITGEDLQNYLNPEGSTTKFLATNPSYSAAITAVIANSTAQVKGALDERRRRLLTCVRGLYLTREAVGDGTETTFTIPLIAQTASTSETRVWVNYCGLWRNRKIANAVDATCDGTTITLADALSEGDSAVAEIPHDGTNIPQILKDLCIKIAVQEMLMRQNRLVGDIDRDLFSVQFQNTREDLKALRSGNLSVNEWEDLDLVDDEETITPPGQGFTELGW